MMLMSRSNFNKYNCIVKYEGFRSLSANEGGCLAPFHFKGHLLSDRAKTDWTDNMYM